MRAIAILGGLTLLAAACAGPTPAFDPAQAARAKSVVAEMAAAAQRQDLDAVMACFTDDAALLPPEGPVVATPAEIRQHFAALFRDFELKLTVRSERSVARGDLASDRGLTTGELVSRGTRASQSVSDRYLAVLRRAGSGAWKIFYLEWTPADGAAPGAR
jgi:ketosteroid isomerase-like protein